MDLKTLIADVAKLAKTTAGVIPGMSEVSAAVDLGQKVMAVVDSVAHHNRAAAASPEGNSLAVSRKELADAVKVKADQTADRLRG